MEENENKDITPAQAVKMKLESDNELLKKEIAGLDKKEQEWKETVKENRKLQQQVKELESNKNEVVGQLEQKEKDLMKELESHEEARDRLREQRHEIEQLQQQIAGSEQYKTKASQLEQKIKSLMEELTKCEAKADMDGSEISSLQQQIGQLQQQIKGLELYQTEAEELRRKIKGLEPYQTEAEELRRKVKGLEPYKAEAEKLRQQVKELQAFQRRMPEPEHNKPAKSSKASLVLLSLITIYACAASVFLYFSVNNNHYKYAQLKEENNSLKAEYDSLQLENSSLEESYHSLKEDIASLTEENGSLEEGYHSLEEDIASLTEENSSLKEMNDSLNLKNSSLENDNDQLSSRNDSLQKENSEIKPEYSFFHEYAVIVMDDQSDYYHHFGCEEIQNSDGGFYIYNIKAAIANKKHACPSCFD